MTHLSLICFCPFLIHLSNAVTVEVQFYQNTFIKTFFQRLSCSNDMSDKTWVNDSAWHRVKNKSLLKCRVRFHGRISDKISTCDLFFNDFVWFRYIFKKKRQWVICVSERVDSSWWTDSGDLTQWTNRVVCLLVYKCVFQEPPEIISKERRLFTWNMKRTYPWRRRRWGKYVLMWGEDGRQSDTSASITDSGEQLQPKMHKV